MLWVTLSGISFGETAMPWPETDPMFRRLHFAQDLPSGRWTMTELCTRYGISRNTDYKWRDRLLSLGVRGLEEHSRVPLHRRMSHHRRRSS